MYGDECAKGIDGYYSLTIRVHCHVLAVKPEIDSIDKKNQCSPVINMKSVEGCIDFDATPWVRLLGDYAYVIGIVCVVVGIVLAFAGRILFNVVIIIVNGLATFFIMMFIFSL